jgi:hypothetical protein
MSHSARREGASITMNNYARLSNGSVVYIHGHENGLFSTVRVDRDEESQHRQCELVPWTPVPGERVTEHNKEDCITGLVLEASESTAHILWSGFAEPQIWRNTKLEPAWD